MPELTRSRIRNLIEDELVLINRRPATKAGAKLKDGDQVEITLPEPQELLLQGEEIPLEILYEDDDLLVINKPRGLVVHPSQTSPTGTLVHGLMGRRTTLSGIGGVLRPGIVHRLDKDTSGLIMVAKSDLAHHSLQQQIQKRTAKRKYLALVHGNLKEDSGTIEAPIGRHPVDRKKMAVVQNGRPSITHWKVLERFKGKYALLECSLETGRTHQIRVHMAYNQHPVVGDPLYGIKREEFNLSGQILHAYRLDFTHPRNGQPLHFEAPPPKEFADLLELLRRKYPALS